MRGTQDGNTHLFWPSRVMERLQGNMPTHSLLTDPAQPLTHHHQVQISKYPIQTSKYQNIYKYSNPTFPLTDPAQPLWREKNDLGTIIDKYTGICKGTPPAKKNFFVRTLPEFPLPPPNSGKLYNFFWTSKTTFLRVLQNQVTMITTMM